MLNAFDFVDQLFSGIVAFVYSVVSTAARLLFTPTAAPLRLVRRYRDPRTRQISGMTTLALAFAGICSFSLLIEPPSGRIGLAWTSFMPDRQGALRTGELVPFLFGGVTSTIVIDVAIRFWLSVSRVRAASRQRIAAALAYAFSFYPIGMFVFFQVQRLPAFARWLGTVSDGVAQTIVLTAGLLLLLRGSLLVTTTGARLQGARLGLLLLASSTFLAAALSMGALIVGVLITSNIILHNQPAAEGEAATLFYKDCRVNGDTATAIAVYFSHRDQPEQVHPEQLRIRISRLRPTKPDQLKRGGKPIIVQHWTAIEKPFRPDAPPIIEAGKLLTLRDTFRFPTEGLPASPACDLVEAS